MRRDKVAERRRGIAACEALLAGRFVEQLEESGSPVPSWAWMNLLAHASEETLRQAALGRPTGRVRRTDVWQRAQRYLAGEILDAAARGGTLRSLQAQVLVPLELELMTPRRSGPRSPGAWAARVMAALEQHRPATGRPVGDRHH
jgi:hypothetical protein